MADYWSLRDAENRTNVSSFTWTKVTKHRNVTDRPNRSGYHSGLHFTHCRKWEDTAVTHVYEDTSNAKSVMQTT